MYLNVVDVKTLHGPETTVVKQYHNGDYLTDAHFGWFLGRVAQQSRVEGSFEAVAKVINGTEYFSGFIVGKVHGKTGYVFVIAQLNIASFPDFSDF